MQKLLISALAVAGLTLTGCNDEEKNALSEQVKKQTQTIEQLNAQVNTLQRQVLDLAFQHRQVHEVRCHHVIVLGAKPRQEFMQQFAIRWSVSQAQ